MRNYKVKREGGERKEGEKEGEEEKEGGKERRGGEEGRQTSRQAGRQVGSPAHSRVSEVVGFPSSRPCASNLRICSQETLERRERKRDQKSQETE